MVSFLHGSRYVLFQIDLGGYPVILSDTAGIRENTNDIVEKEGVHRAITAANNADILVLVEDASNVEDTIEFNEAKLRDFGLEDNGQEKIVILNKSDLVNDKPTTGSDNAILLSGKTGRGMDSFLERLRDRVGQLCETSSIGECPGLTRARHRTHLSKAVNCLEQYLEDESNGLDHVICAHHLRKSLREIGFITGKVSSEKILDVIFADFCIGK